jgi:hypothetical protein
LSFFDKNSRHYLTLGDINTVVRMFGWNFCYDKTSRYKNIVGDFFYQGSARLPKLPLFVITNFFYARKSRFFSSLPTHYRGAWGTPSKARRSRVIKYKYHGVAQDNPSFRINALNL